MNINDLVQALMTKKDQAANAVQHAYQQYASPEAIRGYADALPSTEQNLGAIQSAAQQAYGALGNAGQYVSQAAPAAANYVWDGFQKMADSVPQQTLAAPLEPVSPTEPQSSMPDAPTVDADLPHMPDQMRFVPTQAQMVAADQEWAASHPGWQEFENGQNTPNRGSFRAMQDRRAQALVAAMIGQ